MALEACFLRDDDVMQNKKNHEIVYINRSKNCENNMRGHGRFAFDEFQCMTDRIY